MPLPNSDRESQLRPPAPVLKTQGLASAQASRLLNQEVVEMVSGVVPQADDYPRIGNLARSRGCVKAEASLIRGGVIRQAVISLQEPRPNCHRR